MPRSKLTTLATRVGRWFVSALLLAALSGGWISWDNEIAQEISSPVRLSVKAVIPKNFPPQYGLDSFNQPTGFAVDVMELVANQANLDVSYQVVDSWDEVLEAVRSGRADLIPNLGITPKRQAEFAFTSPVETFPVVLIVRQSEQTIHGAADLVGRSVITNSPSVGIDLLQHRPRVELKVVDTMEQALFQLLAGEADVLTGPEPVIQRLARSVGLEDRIKVVGRPLIEIKRAIAVRKDNSALLARLDQASRAVVKSAEYRRIYTRWYGQAEHHHHHHRTIWILLGSLLLLLFVLFILQQLNRRLESMVQQRTAALQQSEERYRQLAEDMPTMICKFLPDSTLTYVNSAYCRYFNKRSDELIGSRFLDFLPSEAARQVTQAHYLSLTPDAPSTIYEHPVVRPDSGQAWQQWVDRAFFDEQGRITSVQSIGVDVTERKDAEAALKNSEERFRQLAENIQEVFWMADLEFTQLLYVSPAYETIWGRTCASLYEQPKSFVDAIHPADRDHALAVMQQQRRQGWELEYRIIQPDGTLRWIREQAFPVLNSTRKNSRVVGICQDITDRKQTEAAILESEARYRLLAENMNDLVCLQTDNGRYLYVSQSCETLLGYRADQMLGQDSYPFIHPEDRDRVHQAAHAAVTSGEPTAITYRMRRKSGEYIWFETLIKPILDGRGHIVHLQTTSRDVTERVEVQNQLEYEALHDGLTGLPNRHLLMERLELAVNRTKRFENYHFAVIFLDLDRFKVINDSLGHLVGDQLLIAVAQKLTATLRAVDLAVRLGGDEFVILLEDVKDIQEAVRATERIFEKLQTPLTIEGRAVYTTASVGIVLSDREYEQASHLLRDADIAMYRAKSEGKARYEIFDSEMHAQAMNRLHLENDLRCAIEGQEFVLHYQPIVALNTGYPVGFEALIRWLHPDQGLKSPGEFIAIAEEIGLISSLDHWTLQTACHQLANWQRAFPDFSTLKVSVNLSAQDLRQPNFLEAVDCVLSETRLNGGCLTLEITESMLIEDVESTIDLLSQLKARGIQISIDDFGIGYSSLSYLHRLPVDSLKIDRSFIGQMLEGKSKHQIVETIVALSDQLELDTIAEGIETQQQLQQLQRLGYNLGQGYLFAKPLSCRGAEALLAKWAETYRDTL
ncbi:MAG: EAL domain-containing protein [Leptolyngbyaceae cyanobacterium MO_188.B28]|nr:EAL domain-containing protein [Leptolyngbyaceae cyanobacterium MO_188.B28]